MRSALAALTFSVFFALSFSNADAECVKKIKVHHGCAQPTRHVAPSGADVRVITAEQIATAKKQQEIADQAIARLIQEQENLRVAKERANVEIDDRKGRVDREIAELRERTGREIAEAKQRAERDLAPAREEAAKLRQSALELQAFLTEQIAKAKKESEEAKKKSKDADAQEETAKKLEQESKDQLAKGQAERKRLQDWFNELLDLDPRGGGPRKCC